MGIIPENKYRNALLISVTIRSRMLAYRRDSLFRDLQRELTNITGVEIQKVNIIKSNEKHKIIILKEAERKKIYDCNVFRK